jgi:hypothetical protein
VHRSLRTLAQDLEIRATVLEESLPPAPPEELSPRVNDVLMRLKALRGEARALLSQALEDAAAADVNLRRQLAISQQLQMLEMYDAPLILRWSDSDRVATGVCASLLGQVNWPPDRPKPLVACLSCDYYWVLPKRNMIVVPANEERRLLAIGDLCHELGHLLFSASGAALVGGTLNLVGEHAIATAENPPPGFDADDMPDFAFEIMLAWRHWIQEFVCDAIGTFLVGPAYGWQHFRLTCAEGSITTLYEAIDGDEHPADDARMRTVLEMLKILELRTEAENLNDHWNSLSEAVGATPDDDYQHLYPAHILQSMVETVYKCCVDLGIRPYDPTADATDIPRLTNLAWEKLREDPAAYPDWERDVVNRCASAWGVEPALPVAG